MSVAEDRTTLDELCVNTIRTLSMDAVQKANSGHPGTPMALAPLAYVLYTRVMEHAPSHPEWPDRDRFVLSCGHASMLLYSTLYLTGYGLTLDDLKNFRQLGSPTAGHPEYGHAAGIETTTGPLGQGISTAVGLALAERMLAARFNREGHEIVDHYTYVIASDGDLQEGVASGFPPCPYSALWCPSRRCAIPGRTFPPSCSPGSSSASYFRCFAATGSSARPRSF